MHPGIRSGRLCFGLRETRLYSRYAPIVQYIFSSVYRINRSFHSQALGKLSQGPGMNAQGLSKPAQTLGKHARGLGSYSRVLGKHSQTLGKPSRALGELSRLPSLLSRSWRALVRPGGAIDRVFGKRGRAAYLSCEAPVKFPSPPFSPRLCSSGSIFGYVLFD